MRRTSSIAPTAARFVLSSNGKSVLHFALDIALFIYRVISEVHSYGGHALAVCSDNAAAMTKAKRQSGVIMFNVDEVSRLKLAKLAKPKSSLA